tara:strand:+ start:345 stop:602 length:258 start_codon:yes stop_codon:yes gene_type:complete
LQTYNDYFIYFAVHNPSSTPLHFLSIPLPYSQNSNSSHLNFVQSPIKEFDPTLYSVEYYNGSSPFENDENSDFEQQYFEVDESDF